jgi:hypothetical protein
VTPLSASTYCKMPKTHLYVECPHCDMQYLVSGIALSYSNGAYIENVAGSPGWQRLLCPCRPDTPYKFKLSETMRLRVFSADENEHTHFLPLKKNKPPASGS